jgi:hypothetical protein
MAIRAPGRSIPRSSPRSPSSATRARPGAAQPDSLPSMWLLLGCWQPGAYLPPVPENLARLAADEATPAEEAGTPADEEAAPEDAPADGVPAEEAPAEPEAPAPPPPDAYASHTVGAPLTIVDDVGKPVTVLTASRTEVIVLLEEPPVRKRVRCTGCVPQAEGWLQFDNVEPK